MNTANSSTTSPPTRESFEAGTTIEKSLFQTPEKEKAFDPEELMKMDLIPTPPSTDHKHEPTEQDTSKWSKAAKMNLRARMICHEDFPRLLRLLHLVKHGRPCSNETNEATVKLMRDDSKLNDLIIYRGQCSFTDYHMDYYLSRLQSRLKMRANARTTSSKYGEFPFPFFTPVKEQGRDKIMTMSDLIEWANTYVTISQSMKKQRTLAQLKKRCGNKIRALKRTMKKKASASKKQQVAPKARSASSKSATEKKRDAAAAFGSSLIGTRKPSLTTPSAFLDFSSLKLDAHSHITHSKDTIASDVAITMTPRPFKKSKTYGSPPSRVTTQRTEVLSDITTRSEKGIGINVAGDHLAAPRVELFANRSPPPTSPIAKFSLSKINEEPTEEDRENRPGTLKENSSLPGDEASKTTNESTHNSEAKHSVKKDPENAGTQDTHILAVAFS